MNSPETTFLHIASIFLDKFYRSGIVEEWIYNISRLFDSWQTAFKVVSIHIFVGSIEVYIFPHCDINQIVKKTEQQQ